MMSGTTMKLEKLNKIIHNQIKQKKRIIKDDKGQPTLRCLPLSGFKKN